MLRSYYSVRPEVDTWRYLHDEEMYELSLPVCENCGEHFEDHYLSDRYPCLCEWCAKELDRDIFD